MKCVAAVLATVMVVSGCGRAEGVADTRRALEAAGFRDVGVSLRSGGGIGVARVEAGGSGGLGPEIAAQVTWETLPVRFDQLVVALGDHTASFAYSDLAGRFGPRHPSLDGSEVDEQLVESGLKLMLLLSAGAILSVTAVVVTARRALRAGRRARAGGAGQEAGPTSGLVAGSPTADVPGASESADEIPS